MSVTLTFTIGMTPLQRLQPIDPSFQADWSASLTGDASGGTSTTTGQFAADIGVIMEYTSALENSGTITDARTSFRLGRVAGPASVTQLAITSQTVVPVGGTSNFYWEPPRTMVIPSLGGQVEIQFTCANTDGAAVVIHGRAYCWPRNEVIDLPQRTFWPYLTH